jgi:hypothetical protein
MDKRQREREGRRGKRIKLGNMQRKSKERRK